MGEFRRCIRSVLLEMHETDAGVFRVMGNGRYLVTLMHSRDDGHGRWLCPCGEQSGKRDPMLAHVVAEFVKQPPLLTADRGRTFEAMNTYLRLVGKHADPTYEQAVNHRCRSF